MTQDLLQRCLATFGLVAMWAVSLGMLYTGKARQSVAFLSYVSVGALYGLMITFRPDLHTPEAYSIKSGIYFTLFFLMAMEIGFKSFGAFQGVARWAKGLLAAFVAASTAAVLFLTPQSLVYADLASYEAPITTAAIWCLSFVALLVVWYQIPVPAFTRSLLLSFVPYLAVFVVCDNLLVRHGWGIVKITNSMNALAYDVMATYVAYAAWRKD